MRLLLMARPGALLRSLLLLFVVTIVALKESRREPQVTAHRQDVVPPTATHAPEPCQQALTALLPLRDTDTSELRRELREQRAPFQELLSGLPKTVVLTSEEVRAALEEPLVQIIDAIKETLDRTPPELASDIMDRGIMLAGGGSLLQGLDERLREETQMPAHLAESPLTCVAVGSGRSLEEFEVIHRTNKNSRGKPRRRF